MIGFLNFKLSKINVKDFVIAKRYNKSEMLCTRRSEDDRDLNNNDCRKKTI